MIHVCLVLGDNIFYGAGFQVYSKIACKAAEEGARLVCSAIMSTTQKDMVLLNLTKNGNCLSIEEKPAEA